jgi:hypothetical protein
MLEGKDAWVELCKEFFSTTADPPVGTVELFEWFDACGPSKGEGVEISIVSTSLRKLVEVCGLLSLSANNYSSWYEYDALRNKARAESHFENSRKRIVDTVTLARNLSGEYDKRSIKHTTSIK